MNPSRAILEWAATRTAITLWRCQRYGWPHAPSAYTNYAGGHTPSGQARPARGGAKLVEVRAQWHSWRVHGYVSPHDLKRCMVTLELDHAELIQTYLRADPNQQRKAPQPTPDELNAWLIARPILGVKLERQSKPGANVLQLNTI